MKRYATPADLLGAVGTEHGPTPPREVSQQLVLDFAAVTGDHQWIHTDPGRAAGGPFGGPVAHGFLIASLLPSLLNETLAVDGCSAVVNRGVDELRFRAPVPCGARITASFTLHAARIRARDLVECEHRARVDVLDGPAPACTARLTYLYRPEPER